MKIKVSRAAFVIKRLAWFAVVALVSCQGKLSSTTPPTLDRVSMEHIVFTTVIPELYGSEPIFVIEQNSQMSFADYYIDNPEQLAKEFPAIEPDTVNDFTAVNSESHSLQSIFSQDTKFVLVNREDYLRPMMCVETPCIDLEKLQQKYPSAKGVIMLSKVGFNNEATQSLVFAEIDDGDYKGEFFLVLLKRQNQQWIIEDTIRIEWVS